MLRLAKEQSGDPRALKIFSRLTEDIPEGAKEKSDMVLYIGSTMTRTACAYLAHDLRLLLTNPSQLMTRLPSSVTWLYVTQIVDPWGDQTLKKYCDSHGLVKNDDNHPVRILAEHPGCIVYLVSEKDYRGSTYNSLIAWETHNERQVVYRP